MHLETDRLTIRPWRVEEAPRLLDILGRMEVMKWLGDGEPVLMTDLDQARQRVARYAALSAQPPLGLWAAEVRETGQVAGTMLLLELPGTESHEVEIGWHLHPDSWGRGYASEAGRALLGHAFGAGLPEVLAVTHTDNHASQAVCRRIGMHDEGVVEKWYAVPMQLFRITADDHHALAGG